MTPRPLFIRADADGRMGIGHAMRMMALGEAWRRRGGQFVLAGRLPATLIDRLLASGGVHVLLPPGLDAAVTVEAAREVEAQWVVADGYHFGEDFQQSVIEAGFRLLVVDDNGENAEYCSDLVLNQNVHASLEMYTHRAATTEMLLGPRYALIRQEITDAAQDAVFWSRPVDRCLATFGGADPQDVTGRLLTGLRQTSFEWKVVVGGANPRAGLYEALAPPGVQLVHNTTQFAFHARQCQMAFSASGSTVWELALLQLPSAVVSVADNQTALARRLAEWGVVMDLGDARSTDVSGWTEALENLARDAPLRRRLVDAARALVDGRGAARVVDKLLEVA